MRTELKKLIRKELRISTNVISDNDVENLAAALDGDRTGWVRPRFFGKRIVGKKTESVQSLELFGTTA